MEDGSINGVVGIDARKNFSKPAFLVDNFFRIRYKTR